MDEKDEFKALIPLMTDDVRLYMLQTGQITLYDMILFESVKNEPYDYLFMALPFEQALDWSLRIAKESVYSLIERKVKRIRRIEELKDGFLTLDLSDMYDNELIEEMKSFKMNQ